MNSLHPQRTARQSTYLALTERANNKSTLSGGRRYRSPAPRLLLPEQTAVVDGDSHNPSQQLTCPVPATQAPRQGNGTHLPSLSSLHRDLLSWGDILAPAGTRRVRNLQGGGSSAARLNKTPVGTFMSQHGPTRTWLVEVTEQATAVHSSALTLSEFGIKYKVEKTWLKHPEVISTHISNAGNSFPCRPPPQPLCNTHCSTKTLSSRNHWYSCNYFISCLQEKDNHEETSAGF